MQEEANKQSPVFEFNISSGGYKVRYDTWEVAKGIMIAAVALAGTVFLVLLAYQGGKWIAKKFLPATPPLP